MSSWIAADCLVSLFPFSFAINLFAMAGQPRISAPGRYKDFFFRIDPRSLGLFRILFAMVLIALWVIRWRWLYVMYTDAGVLPRDVLNITGSFYSKFTPLAWIGSEWGVRLFFLGALASYVMLLVGYRTRLASVLSLLFFISISHRNPFILIGADNVLGSMLIWCPLLPLGARFSIDAVRKAMRSGVALKDRGKADSTEYDITPSPAVERAPASLAAFFIVLHFGMIYLFTGLWKTGVTWWEQGTAIYYVLHMEQSLYALGAILAEAPQWLLTSAVYGTLILEYVALPAMLIPWGQPWLRRILLLVLAGFHVGIALTLDAGVFSYAMMACFPLLLLPRDWEALGRFGRRCSRPVTAYYDDNCGICTASCKLLTVLDRFGMISCIGNSMPEKFRHDVSPDLAQRTIVVIDDRSGRQGVRSQGVAMLLRSLPLPWPLLSVIGWPGVRVVSDVGYNLVANNRTRISSLLGMTACSVPQPGTAKPEAETIAGEGPAPARSLGNWPALIGNTLAVLFLASFLCAIYYRNVVPILRLQPDYESPLNRTGLFVMDFTNLTMADQYWNMFAPDAPAVDAWWVAEAFLEDGRRIDLFNGGAPSDLQRQPRYWETPFTSVWGNYLRHTAALGMLLPRHMIPNGAFERAIILRQATCAYVLREYEKTGGPEILELNLYLAIKYTPAPNEPDNDIYTTLSTMTYDPRRAEGDRFYGPDRYAITYVYNEDGARIAEGTRDPWNDFKLEGLWTDWLQDGSRKLRTGTFVAGVAEGRWTEYVILDDGAAATSIGMMHDGLKQGEWITTGPNGVLIGEATFVDGELNGPWKRYFTDGRIQAEGEYKNGLRSGPWRYFSADGVSEVRGEYLADKRHGEWLTLEQDVVVSLETFDNDVLNGPWRNAWDNGQIESQGQYKDGKRVGHWEFFHADGERKTAGEYVDGKRQGEWTEWITGGLSRTRLYKDGELVD